jgi:hydroxymethylpyrimidine pyrophosphatase-like HAD family hydrolase
MKAVTQEKPVTTNHEKLGKIEFPVEVMQVETDEEMVTDAGGAESLRDFYNGQRATNAKNAARAFARNFEVPEGVELTPEKIAELVQQIKEKGQKLALDYTPSADTERGPSKAKKAAAFDEIATLVSSGKEFTMEELQGLLAKAK